MADSAAGLRDIPRERLYREAFGTFGDKDAPVIYRCEIPDYWTDELFRCIELGQHAEKWGLDDWIHKPAMILDAIDLYDSVVGAWREEQREKR